MIEDSKMVRVGGHGVGTGRLWRIALLTLAGVIGAASEADAAVYYWSGYDPSYYYQPAPTFPQRRPRVRRYQAKKIEAPEKESTKPQGPLIIAISIEKQSLKIYDANGFFAETPISTGMRGHPTPMGVFSIIQKHKFHHSNIYSNAPMPYMQRFTWSGVAMHAGVLPGYPASHGCIRMPLAFAMKMWNWTKMGARVIVTPGEISPANFSHPLLVAQKVVPQPVIADEPKTDAPAIKSDKGADAGSAIKSASAEANLELRSTVGHATPLREQTHTANARGAMPSNAAVTMSDAASSNAQPAKSADAPGADAVKSGAEAAPAASAETVSSEAKTEASKSVKADDKSADAKVEAQPDEVRIEAAKAGVAKVENPKVEAINAEAAKVDTAKAVEPKAIEKPAEPVNAVADVPATASADVKKDPARLPGVEKAAAAKPEPLKRTGQISAFVSRKDSKLYVRQNFAPLFEVPVTIAPSDRMLGTHVFTANVDKTDPNLLRWSVVSLPVTARNAAVKAEDERASRPRQVAVSAAAAARP